MGEADDNIAMKFGAAALGCLAVHVASAFMGATLLPWDPLTASSRAITEATLNALA